MTRSPARTPSCRSRRLRSRRVVRVSALKASLDGPTDNTRQHGRTEQHLAGSGLAYAVLRPHFFVQNLLGMLGSIRAEGKIYFGTGKGKLGMVDTRDVSDAVVATVLTDAFDGGIHELTGPESIDFDQVAAAVGRGLGKDVQFVPVPPTAVAETVRAHGGDAWTADLLRDYSTAYASGFGDFTTGEVERITGKPPRSLDRFIEEVLVPAARG